jgi:uncharacterized protein
MKKFLIKFLLVCLLAINLLAIIHAYRFTHTTETIHKTAPPEKLSLSSKIEVLLFGINLPKLKNSNTPKEISSEFDSFTLPDKFHTPIWLVKHLKSKGLVLLFHGYSANRQTLLPEAKAFYDLGYDVSLVDFPGHGDSHSNVTTLGYHEAEVVKNAFDYFIKRGRKTIFLYGASMGATAIMRAIAELGVSPVGAILDYPYYSLLATARKRFEVMGLRINFPLPELLTFWGGLINGFNAFGLNGKIYAQQIKTPVLLCGGDRDIRVPPEHLAEMRESMAGPSRLVIIPGASHESLLISSPALYLGEIKNFLSKKQEMSFGANSEMPGFWLNLFPDRSDCTECTPCTAALCGR